jgi:site-specific recombinase XerD
LVSPAGKGIERKTVNRKVSAIITYFLWLRGLGAITRDPTLSLNNARIQSPLPDYLYENEIGDCSTVLWKLSKALIHKEFLKTTGNRISL